jgi:hypothetical protein
MTDPPSPDADQAEAGTRVELGFGSGREGLTNLRDACDRSLERLEASPESDPADPALAASIRSLRIRTIDALAEHERRRSPGHA